MEKTIFVVDDSTTNLSIIEAILEEQYRVITLSSAAKMFTLLEKLMPDLILLDIEMPDIDGFEALQQLKSNEMYAGVPVIFITGMLDAATKNKGLEMGAVDFIKKPFAADILQDCVNTYLSS